MLRLYLTIGFVALLGLAVLAITSTDGMVRRLGGKRWQRLHQIVYVLSLLALIHFFQQTKADVWLPTFVAGLFGWLMGYRILIWRKTERGELSTLTLVALAVGVAVLTFLAEAVGIGYRVQCLAVAGAGDGVRLRSVFDPAGLDGACGWTDRRGGRTGSVPGLRRYAGRRLNPYRPNPCQWPPNPAPNRLSGSHSRQPFLHWSRGTTRQVIPLSHSFL